MKPINLAEKLSRFTNHWSPRIVGAFNGHDLMVVKVMGEFNWHDHPKPMISLWSFRANWSSTFLTARSP
jgi:hypothetical protein